MKVKRTTDRTTNISEFLESSRKKTENRQQLTSIEIG